MGHLKIRMTPQDESNLAKLMGAWHLNRSEAARKALALAAEQVTKEMRYLKTENNVLESISKFL